MAFVDAQSPTIGSQCRIDRVVDARLGWPKVIRAECYQRAWCVPGSPWPPNNNAALDACREAGPAKPVARSSTGCGACFDAHSDLDFDGCRACGYRWDGTEPEEIAHTVAREQAPWFLRWLLGPRSPARSTSLPRMRDFSSRRCAPPALRLKSCGKPTGSPGSAQSGEFSTFRGRSTPPRRLEWRGWRFWAKMGGARGRESARP